MEHDCIECGLQCDCGSDSNVFCTTCSFCQDEQREDDLNDDYDYDSLDEDDDIFTPALDSDFDDDGTDED